MGKFRHGKKSTYGRTGPVMNTHSPIGLTVLSKVCMMVQQKECRCPRLYTTTRFADPPDVPMDGNLR